MRYVQLGATNLQVSAVCMGTVNYGSRMRDAESFAELDRFLEKGGNFLDSARVYADWLPGVEQHASEKCLGRWLKARQYPEHVVIATKGGHPPIGTNERPTLEKEQLFQQADESRRHLGLDVLPLYYLHRDDAERPIGQIMDALFELQDKGVILHAACSNWTAPRIREAQAYAKSCDRPGFVAVSNQWSLARTVPGSGDTTLVHTDDVLRNLHQETQLPLIPFSSTAQGYLSLLAEGGKISTAQQAQYGVPANAEIARRASIIASRHDMTVAQVCLCFFYHQPFPVIPITSFLTNAQMDEAIAGCDLSISEEEMAWLNDV